MSDDLIEQLLRAPLYEASGEESDLPDEAADRIRELEAEIAALREGRGVKTFQARVHDWIVACFGEEIGADPVERNHRFIEEALELVQANGCTQSEAHQLVDYVFSRPAGDPHQEVGGVMNTLAALCTASGLDMRDAGEDELARVWTKVEKIRAKQAAKPKHSPLPQDVSALSPAPVSVEEVLREAQFLVDRLNEFELTDDAYEMTQAYIGHIEPSQERLRAALRALSEGEG